ncbi:hypothetical protein N7530_009955 [Penicillium desertorum]|uniref:Uncharacterized protein n=1 Tax=Penicillium desertorum TaxID=1303715 RepID=A0A9X0BIN8_9EURO|nr:hypothetical protein N7530_009955 [Penicillium desertorum]
MDNSTWTTAHGQQPPAWTTASCMNSSLLHEQWPPAYENCSVSNKMPTLPELGKFSIVRKFGNTIL